MDSNRENGMLHVGVRGTPRGKKLENNERMKKMKDTHRDKDGLGMKREAERGNRKKDGKFVLYNVKMSITR